MTAYVPTNSSSADKVSAAPTTTPAAASKIENACKDTNCGFVIDDYRPFPQYQFENPLLNVPPQYYANNQFPSQNFVRYDPQLLVDHHHHQQQFQQYQQFPYIDPPSFFENPDPQRQQQYIAATSAIPQNYSTNVAETNQQFITPASDAIELELEEIELWKKFHSIGTEMIITKSGRRIFPTLRLKIKGLDPEAKYVVTIEILPYDDNRYKYNNNSWMVTGKAEPHIQNFPYIHPESPMTGAQLMKQPMSFKKLKVTNNPSAQGQIVLNSLHKYNPRINIFKYDELTGTSTCVHSRSFTETTFIAVTAYQNEAVTNLKIDNNPFAKGFRENHRRDRTLKRDYRTAYGCAQLDDSDQNKRARRVGGDTFNQNRPTYNHQQHFMLPQQIIQPMIHHRQQQIPNPPNGYFIPQQQAWS